MTEYEPESPGSLALESSAPEHRFRAAAVLAGGASERMGGRDKQFLDAGGMPLAFRILNRLGAVFPEFMIVTNRPEGYRAYPGPLQAFPDRVRGFGPLSGLHAALSASSSPWVYVVACDTPEFDARWVRTLSEAILREEGAGRAPLAAAAGYGNHLEPFHAFYSRDLLPHIESCFSRRTIPDRSCSIGSVLSGLQHLRIEESVVRSLYPDWGLFRNINTPEDWASYRRDEAEVDDPVAGLQGTPLGTGIDDKKHLEVRDWAQRLRRNRCAQSRSQFQK
ncbi:MAG: molybdenum cofactor guanylyltransferase [Treponema sp.]|nr:molybdenum cofactor guanylyltransferase [Treponema sp.]